ncbi:MAG TPA: RDD family protein, partial [Chthoniobacteraceae bacterium]|nr:RDD family protein [Chthoniobacteraceae bacterium]
ATGVLTAGDRRRAAAIVARVGQPTEQAMTEARIVLGAAIDAEGVLDLAPHYPKSGETSQPLLYGVAFGGFIWAILLSLAAALLFRGGVLMRALGIAVVKRDGADASRLRMLWRACVAWAPLPLGGVLLAMLVPVLPAFTAAALAAAVVLALVVWSAARRGRSLQDLLAGTWLVPR